MITKFLIIILGLHAIEVSAASNYFEKCSSPFINYHASFGGQCAPDTLYTWKSTKEAKRLVDRAEKGIFFDRDETYTWRTPIGTFGYGDVAIRIKLKSDVNFVMRDNIFDERECSYLRKKYGINNVFVGYYKEIIEYVVCGDEVIDSWSVLTKENFQEMKKEFNWIQSYGVKNADVFLRPTIKNGKVRKPWEFNDYDNSLHTDWSLTKLKRIFTEYKNSGFKQKIFFSDDYLNTNGDYLELFYQKLRTKSSDDDSKRDDYATRRLKHFKSKIESYFRLSI